MAFQVIPSYTDEGENVFKSPLYQQYRKQLTHFIRNHPDSTTAPALELLQEVEKAVTTPDEQRRSHEILLNKIRTLTIQQRNEKFTRDLVHWLFLGADLNPEMTSFLYSYVQSPHEDSIAYFLVAQERLKTSKQFSGMEAEPYYEDQFLHANLPSKIGTLHHQTELIRMGQPIRDIPGFIWFWPSQEVSPEFLLFLESQPSHLYINLMKRKGSEGSKTKAIEALEKKVAHLYVVTLDKNSSFYSQSPDKFPTIWKNSEFKKAFLRQLQDKNGHYFWSHHLSDQSWQEELIEIINQVHTYYFSNQVELTRQERQDFIELAYLLILDRLVEKWKPASLNVTCRQGIDRGPSLMALWMIHQGLIDEREAAVQLLAPPLIVRNRPSHRSRIERFSSALRIVKK